MHQLYPKEKEKRYFLDEEDTCYETEVSISDIPVFYLCWLHVSQL